MRKQSLLVMLLAAMLVLGIALAGCAQGGSAEKKPVDGASGEIVKVSWAFWDMAKINYALAQNAYCREKMGIEIDPIALDWGTWSEQVKLMAATDSMPDVVSTYTTSDMVRLSAWIEQGIIRDIPKEMVAKYKYLKGNFDSSIPLQGFTKVWDDKYWFMPRTDYFPETYTSTHFGIYYRRDWAEKLGHKGYDVVEENVVTLDMIKQMYVDFTTKDPDGDGANDTYGLSLDGSVNSKLLGSFGVDADGWFLDTDGKYKPGYVNPKVVDALEYYQDLYQLGALDPEFPNNDYKGMVAKAAVQTVGAFWRQVDMSAYAGNVFSSIWESDKDLWDDPASKWAILSDPWVDENTPPRLTNIDDMCGSEIAAHVPDEKLEAILKAQDWMLSEDGLTVKVWGMEKVNYNIVDGRRVPIPDVPAADGYTLPGALGIWYSSSQYDPDLAAYRAEQYELNQGMPKDYWLKTWEYCKKVAEVRNKHYDPALKNIEMTFIFTPSRAEWTPGYGDRFTQWVIADVDIKTEFEKYVQELYDKGLQGLIDEVNNMI